MHDKPGTVGRLLPQVEYFLQAVEGIEIGGRLCVKGPNVMQGYIKPNNPGVIEPTSVENLGSGWYDTGDIVSIDNEGYVTILGREKRFAKIAGEMLSLAAIEEMLISIDTEFNYAAICVEDDKKGEKIILFTTNRNINRELISKTCKDMQLSELYIPKIIVLLKDLPVLPTGKLNYRLMIEMAKEQTQD